MYRVRSDAAAEAGRLLRLLLIWITALSADPGGACGRRPLGFLLCGLAVMATDTVQRSRDWLSDRRTNVVAWWIPKAAIVVGLFVPPPMRAVMWIISLVWMGAACILNSRRCGRTHCRYTGPYYLAMIAPVLVLASGIISVDLLGWFTLAVLILGGSLVIWWATERAWGKFS
jgi:hypothetical protein